MREQTNGADEVEKKETLTAEALEEFHVDLHKTPAFLSLVDERKRLAISRWRARGASVVSMKRHLARSWMLRDARPVDVARAVAMACAVLAEEDQCTSKRSPTEDNNQKVHL